MNGKHYIGAKAQTADNVYTYPPVSKVILIVDDENIFEAGTDEGTVIERECPYATQAMADNLLSTLQGYQYQSIEAEAARISPLAELGDGITVNGIYTQLAYKNIRFSSGAVVDVAAPSNVEAEHEYQQIGSTSSNTNWKLVQTYSRINKTAEEIQLEVGQLNGTVQSLSLTIDGVTISGPSGETLIDGAVIDTSRLNANSITADKLNLTGSITFEDLNSNVQSDINTAKEDASTAKEDASTVKETIDEWTWPNSTYIDGTKIETGTVTAARVQSETVQIIAGQGTNGGIELRTSSNYRIGKITLTEATSTSYSALEFNSGGALRFVAQTGDAYMQAHGKYIQIASTNVLVGNSNLIPTGDGSYSLGISSQRWSTVYAQSGVSTTSDRAKKKDINYDISKYDAFFDMLKPASCKYVDGTSGRTHLVLVSQDVEEALIQVGLSSQDFGGFVKAPRTDNNGDAIDDEYDYFLRYDEFIALCIRRIQQDEKRINVLEQRLM